MMIVYLLLKAFDSIVFGVLSIIPVIETPAWFLTNLPDVLFRIASFNWYLPVYETVGVVISLIGLVFGYKVFKIILNFFNIDLNS